MTFARFLAYMRWATLVLSFAMLDCVFLPPVLGQVLDFSLVSERVWAWAVVAAFLIIMGTCVETFLIMVNHQWHRSTKWSSNTVTRDEYSWPA